MASNARSLRQSILIDLLNLDTYYPILEILSSYLTLADFAVLCRVCKELEKSKDRMLGEMARVNFRLRHFVNDAIIFRSQMGRYDAIISGSFALDLLELGHGKITYLDLFIKGGNDANLFTNYIREHEDYQKEGSAETTLGREIYSSTLRPSVKLRITRTSGPPIQHILTSSYTTACMNFITWNKAYSIFPQQTLINHRFYPLRSLDDDFGLKLREFATQGWTTRDIIWCESASAKMRTLKDIRRVGQSYTLTILLDTEGVQVPSKPDLVIESAQFEISREALGHNGPQPGLGHQIGFGRQAPFGRQTAFRPEQPQHNIGISYSMNIRAQELTSPALRYVYVTASPQWRNNVKTRLQRWTWIELYKLEPRNRPSQSPAAVPLISEISFPQGFEAPLSWDYADDQMPKWLREWEQR